MSCGIWYWLHCEFNLADSELIQVLVKPCILIKKRKESRLVKLVVVLKKMKVFVVNSCTCTGVVL